MTKKRPIVFVILVCLLISQFFIFGEGAKGDEAYAESPGSWDNVPTNEWMKYVDGNKLINNINIPGTHDSGTQYVTESFTLGAKCQYNSIYKQLEDGVRFLDIRLRNEKGKMRLVHGDIDCVVNEGSSTHLTFETVLQWVDAFLYHNPSETIIMSINENGTNTSKDHTFDDNLYDNYIKNSSVKWETSRTPKQLKDVRGKVVLMSRYGDNERGLDFKKWESKKDFSFSAGGGTAHVQDWYSITAFQRDDKWNAVTQMAVKCENGKYDSDSEYVINFTSATDGIPENVADDINENIRNYDWKLGVKYGWIPMDFVNTSLTKKIYKTNEFVGEPDYMTIKKVEYEKDDVVISGVFEKRNDGFNRKGNVLIMDYFPSNYQGESFVDKDPYCKGTFRSSLKDNSDEFTLRFPKSQIYPISYMIRLREETPSGVLQSYIEPSYINGDSDAYRNTPNLILPEWIKAQDKTIKMGVDYYSAYHYDKTEYSILDNYIPITTGSVKEYEIPNYKLNATYRASVYHEFLEAKHLYDQWYSQGIFLKPNILGIPDDVATSNVTYDSAHVSWNFVGTPENSSVKCDKFKVVVKKNGGDHEMVQYVSNNVNDADILGLEPATDYEVKVTAMGGELENPSEVKNFRTNDAPQLYLTPVFNYLEKASSVPLTATLSKSDAEDVKYNWYEKARSSSGSSSIIYNLTGSSINYVPATSKVMEVYTTASWITASNKYSDTSNKVFVYKDPSAPTGFTAKSSGLTWINLGWNMSDADDITGFEIQHDGGTITVPANQRTVTISGLEPGENYSFSLRAVGLGTGDHQAKSDDVNTTATTLAEAAPPKDVNISRTPADTAPFETDINYSATCTPVGDGELSYQWRINTGSGIFTDIKGATDAAYTLTPSKDNFGNEIYCLITNTLNGTSASAFTTTEHVTFKAPVINNVSVAPTPSHGAVSADLTWVNPELFGYYIIKVTPTGSGILGGKGLPSDSSLTDSAMRYVVKGEGKSGDSMNIQLNGLTPETEYEVRVENVMRDPVTDELLPADLNGILKTKFKTLEGAVAPIITDTPGPTMGAFKGDSVTFTATGEVSPTGTSVYRWSEMTSDLEKRETLSNGTVSGVEKLSSNITVSSGKDGNYYYLEILSTNNGDTKVASSDATKLIVYKEDDGSSGGKDGDKDNDPNGGRGDENSHDSNGESKGAWGANTGDQTFWLLWFMGVILCLVALGLLIRLHRRN